MRQLLLILSVLTLFFSCKEEEQKTIKKAFTKVEVDVFLKDSTFNARALEIDEKRILIATSKSKVYEFSLTSDPRFEKAHYFKTINDTLGTNNFRALASKNGYAYTLSIGSPAKLFKDNRLVYLENNEKAFYDSLDFWNDREGIAIGDPTDDCISIIVTRDGGNSWTKLSCDLLPKANEGEAAFAASDSNISIVGNKTWIATGGKSSRILYSPDKGNTWQVFETPIVQGKETTGMYSLDFYDELNGFAIGGDYTKAGDSTANKIKTIDGGKTWQLVAQNQSPGYRSCVQYVPNSNAKSLVAIGFKGIDYSNDAGETWKHLSDEGFYTLRFLNDSVAYASGNKQFAKLTFK